MQERVFTTLQKALEYAFSNSCVDYPRIFVFSTLNRPESYLVTTEKKQVKSSYKYIGTIVWEA